jgi:hypothetical protein
MDDDFISAPEAARRLHISRRQFDRLVARGVLRAPSRVLGPPRWYWPHVKAAMGVGAGTDPKAAGDATVPPTAPPVPVPADDDWNLEL